MAILGFYGHLVVIHGHLNASSRERFGNLTLRRRSESSVRKLRLSARDQIHKTREVDEVDSGTIPALSGELFVLTTRNEERDNGCIVNAVKWENPDPERLIVSTTVSKDNLTNEMIFSSLRFNLSTIGMGAAPRLFQRFGYQSGVRIDKFAGYDGMVRAANGVYYITESTNSYLSVLVTQMFDHPNETTFIGEVEKFATLSDDPSMTLGTFRRRGISTKLFWAGRPSAELTRMCLNCGARYGGELDVDGVCFVCKHSRIVSLQVEDEVKPRFRLPARPLS